MKIEIFHVNKVLLRTFQPAKCNYAKFDSQLNLDTQLTTHKFQFGPQNMTTLDHLYNFYGICLSEAGANKYFLPLLITLCLLTFDKQMLSFLRVSVVVVL